jgi:hypothetical protein
MHPRRLILVSVLLVGVLSTFFGAFLWNRYLTAVCQERESHFVAIHFLAGEASREADPDGPKNIDDLLRHYDSPESVLLKPFADGLVYRPQGKTFILEEPTSHWISLFRSDRLISTDRKWPRWESTGEFARKFSEQKVPPPGYE